MEKTLNSMASKLGMSLNISTGKILRGIEEPNELDRYSIFLTDERKLDFEVMKEAVRKVFKSGADEKQIFAAVIQTIREETVESVHDK